MQAVSRCEVSEGKTHMKRLEVGDVVVFDRPTRATVEGVDGDQISVVWFEPARNGQFVGPFRAVVERFVLALEEPK